MANFKEAYDIGRVHEGGYSNHPKDKGGETYAGVARKYWPFWAGWKIIDAVKTKRRLRTGDKIQDKTLESLLKHFYEVNFWNKIKGDQIIDQKVANLFYDWVLTSGGAIKKVQESLHINPADGIFGQISVAKMNKAISLIGGEAVFNKIKEARINYYKSLNQPTFIKGWLNRVNSFTY